MFRFLIFIILVYLLYKTLNAVKKINPEQKERSPYQTKSSGGEELIKDPVCHTYVPVSQAYQREISGKIFYFCSKQCSDRYEKEKNN